jgi:predicted O-linked N-acetylglucosamine transferase (SPINDLY family)
VELAALREKLARNVATAPLFDIARYTRGLETAFSRMWEVWQKGEPPQAFAVNDE